MAYHFELPAFTALKENQRLALEENDAIALTGGPGTGKTVVSLWRHIRNYELNNIQSLLLTYTKTLEYYLKQTARIQDEDASNNVNRTLRWTNNPNGNYEEIIIDEAQDVALSRYNIIKNHADIVSYGADEAQSLYCPDCSTIDELRELFPDNEEYELAQNFRNSKEILLFTKAVFPDLYIKEIESATLKERKPYVQELGWDDYEDNVIDEIIEITEDFPEPTHNIGVLLPFEKDVDKYFDLLSDKITCSKYHNKMPDFEELERIHVTTFKSAKGLEFDTVILPRFDSYKWFIDNEKLPVEENDYYVALTRAKLNLYLLCKNDINNIDSDTYDTEKSETGIGHISTEEAPSDDLPF